MHSRTLAIAVFLSILTVFIPTVSAVTQVTMTIQGDSTHTDYTTDTAPNLTITADAGTNPFMRFSCDSTNYSSPIAFQASYSDFDITTGAGCTASDGNKTISVKVTDDTNQTGVIGQGSIILDSTGPVIAGQSPANGARTGNQPSIGFSFSDAGVGITNSNNLSLIINNGNPISSPSLVVNMTTKTATYTPSVPLPEGTVSIEVGALDDLLNPSTTSWSFIVDTNAHLSTIQINSNAAYARSLDANMSAQGDSDLTHCRFKMDGGSYGDWVPFSSNMHFSLSSGDGNKTVWGQCKDSLEHLTEERTDSILLDTTPPSAPTISITAIQPNQANLHWTESTDNGSGLKEFELRKDGTVLATLSATARDYNASGLASNTTYVFRIIARDNAGNESYDDESTTTPSSGTGNNNNNDTTPPTLSWLKPDANAVVSGKIKLRVQVNDNVGVKSVRFYKDNADESNLLAWLQYSGSSQMEFEWDTTTVPDGNHEVIAKADDAAGNLTVLSRKITVRNSADENADDQNNTEENNDAKQGAEQTLENAKDWQQKAGIALDLAKQFSLGFNETENQYAEADSLVQAAEDACIAGDFAECESKSNEATGLFDEAFTQSGWSQESSILLGEPGALDYEGIFSGSKLNPALASFAEQTRNQIGIERHLIVFKYAPVDENNSDNNTDHNALFFVRVELRIWNHSDDQNDFIVIEMVPKMLAQSSGNLAGKPEFVVLEEDPLLEWKLEGLKENEERILSYTINQSFSEQEIQGLLDSEELNSFNLAPLVVKADSIQQTPLLSGTGSDWGPLENLLLPVLIVVVIAIAMATGYFFWRQKKSRHWPGSKPW
jgi:hypothetical protein